MTTTATNTTGEQEQQQVPSSLLSHNNNNNNNNLTCFQTLLPPPKKVGGGGDGEEALIYREQQPAWQCDFSRDGCWLAVAYGSPDPCVRIWTKKKKKKKENKNSDNNNDSDTWVLHSALTGIQNRTIRSVSFAPTTDPIVLASASFDGTVCIWELVAKSNAPSSSSWWDCMAQLEGHDNEVKCVTWNSTGTLLASCGRDKTVWIWESYLPGTVGGMGDGEFECLAVLNGHDGDVKCVHFAASHGAIGDGDEILLSASYDDSIRIWAEEAGDWYLHARLDTPSACTVWSLTVSPNSTRIVAGSADGSLTIYKFYNKNEGGGENDNENGWKCAGRLENAHVAPTPSSSSAVYSVCYPSARCGHGRIASGGADNRIQVYREVKSSVSSDDNDNNPKFELDTSVSTPHGDVNCVCWHPFDGSMMASTGDDGAVSLWHYDSGS